MGDYSPEDQAKDKAWREAADAVFRRGEEPTVVFECHACGHTGDIRDFYAIAPSETDAGLPICDSCVFDPPAADNVNHPFCRLLHFSGRDT